MTRHEPGCPKVYCHSCAVVIGEQHHTARQVLPSLQQSQRPDVKLRGTVMSAWPTGVPWTTVGPPFIAVYGVVDEVIVPAPASEWCSRRLAKGGWAVTLARKGVAIVAI